jgi:AraC family transcriptional regulator of adaptative response/methylated-DNA-[protein]-cysteine methyltransferase
MLAENDYDQLSQDYERIERAISFLEENYRRQPTLKDMAHSVNLSEFHFQRLFTRWVGISPKRFTQYLTKEHAKSLLNDAEDLLSATYESGLSGPGRLHDLFIASEAVTPGEYKARGRGLAIRYGFHSSPFGRCLVAITERGICNLMFLQDTGQEGALAKLRASWPSAEIEHDAAGTSGIVESIIALFQKHPSNPIRLYLSGTNFQLKVWEALLNIPPGSVVSYEDISIFIGIPGGSRAVGNAIARNPVPVLIPCHRVIRKSGDFGQYRWGKSRKKAIHGWEMAQKELTAAQASLSAGVR